VIQKVSQPTQIPAEGDKTILEYVGHISGGIASVSVARMVAPASWSEPFQQPSFDEITLVVRGTVRVEHEKGVSDVDAGEAIIVTRGERIRYSNPRNHDSEYWAICVPAFDLASAGRAQDAAL